MSDASIKKSAYFTLYGGLIIMLILALFLSVILPEEIYSTPRFIIVGIVTLITWLTYLAKVIPRCHKCGYGVFSVLEIKGVPIFAKTTVSKHCSNCGAILEQT
jgi:ribosomal protein S27AE